MRRHQASIVRAASAAGAVALATALAAAAATAAAALDPAKGAHPTCVARLTLEVPWGQTQVLPNESSGTQWGSIRCGRRIGGGLEKLSYTVTASGDEVGTFRAYFAGATIRGSFDLVPQEGTLAPGSISTFGYAAFAGALTHLSGTGSLANVGEKGAATCTSQDGVHFKCTEKL